MSCQPDPCGHVAHITSEPRSIYSGTLEFDGHVLPLNSYCASTDQLLAICHSASSKMPVRHRPSTMAGSMCGGSVGGVGGVGGGWCGSGLWCFQGSGGGVSEPPEITYKVVENGGILNLQPLTPTLPMPDADELDAKFTELVDELDLTAPKREAMFGLPAEKKWQIYCSRKKDEEEGGSTHFPDYYIEKVTAMSMLLYPRDDEDVTVRTKLMDSLKTALRTQPNSFVTRFNEMDGLVCLLNFLSNMDHETAQSSIHTSAIGCLKALMNNSNGRSHVLAHPNSINIIAQSLSTENVKTKIAVLEILGAVCLVPGGHRKVLDAMLHYQKYACERTRFQTIVNDLDRSTGIYRDEVNLKTAVMSFINAVLNYGPGQDHLEFRLHLRYEFLLLGIQPVIDKLRSHENATLDRHLDFFEMVRYEDERELSRKYDKLHVDTKSATGMFEVLKNKLSLTAAFPHFLSLLQHMLLMPLDNRGCSQHWLLYDRLVQQIVLQGDGKNDPDVAPIDIDVKKIVQLLAKEEEIREAQAKAERFEKENSDLTSKLAKKEQEYEIKIQEKEDIEVALDKMRSKLEKESVGHLDAKQKIAELECKLNEINALMESEHGERLRLEQVVQNGSLPDDAKVGLKSSSTAIAFNQRRLETTAPMPPPPPPPPLHINAPPPPPPGPPPPPSGAVQSSANHVSIKKDIPKSSNPLKSFNWSKLPEAKLAGTVWMEMDDTKLYHVMDLVEFDRTFSAYQKQQNDGGSMEDLRQVGTRQTRSREFSVIDGRRAQNCTILLSKLKMTNEDICKAVLSMDSRDKLPKDMIEQMLKFIPSSEEKALLDEHSTEIDQMARADRFLFEINRINHYEQRLKTLFYKKKFTERINECKPKVKAVLEASKEVHRSRRLKRLLEVVLAFGNYMNRGQRGNAGGFRLISLNRIGDTKSSVNRQMTLLHYMVDTLDKQTLFKDALRLEEDIPHSRQAAKVNMVELEKDIVSLKNGLKEIEKELEFHRKQSSIDGDRFVPVMKEFITTATYNFSELEDLFMDMKLRYEKVVKLFGEDPSSVQPDEFFGIFDMFLTSFNEARHDNENFKRKRDEDERRAKQEVEIKKKQQERKDSLTLNKATSKNGSVPTSAVLRNGSVNGYHTVNGTGEKGEFDDLISALRTGDVFGEDMAKLKRARRRAGAGGQNQSPTRTATSAANGHTRDDSREREVSNRVVRKIIA